MKQQRNFIKWLVSRKRNQKGWTQDEFADRLQLAGWHDATRSTVSKIEDGSLRIDLLQLYYITVALGIHPKDFIAEINWHEQVEKMLSFSMKHSQPMETYGDHRKN
ncbi:MAG TPA: helix-turn-helix transcriptional regulator [Candidatus Sulfotelmatobacter sp.]|nr:helix-turn-helix transcriptional regulator [Candidatus Sulfotelmatobacter sp.]